MARRSKEQWLALFQQQQECGLTQGEFCQQQGINPNYFSKRKCELMSPAPAADCDSAFVQLRQPGPDGALLQLKVGLAQLQLPQDVDPRWLASLLRELAA